MTWPLRELYYQGDPGHLTDSAAIAQQLNSRIYVSQYGGLSEALDRAVEVGAGTVFVDMDCTIDELSWSRGIALRGLTQKAGQLWTITYDGPQDGVMLTIPQTGTNVHWQPISGLTLDGAGKAITLIKYQDHVDLGSEITACQFANTTGPALHAADKVTNWAIQDCRFDACEIAIQVDRRCTMFNWYGGTLDTGENNPTCALYCAGEATEQDDEFNVNVFGLNIENNSLPTDALFKLGVNEGISNVQFFMTMIGVKSQTNAQSGDAVFMTDLDAGKLQKTGVATRHAGVAWP